jgi:transaldolase
MDSTALTVKVFGDGADLAGILALAENPAIKGFTTNPTLMRQAGVDDYEAFAHEVLASVTDKPISFEVFSDDFTDMARQARKIASWADNVYVKIPVTNTLGESSNPLVKDLSHDGVKVNVTAMFTVDQVHDTMEALEGGAPANVSVFAGRIADAGIDPIPTMCAVLDVLADHPQVELIWASPREILNIVQAHEIGCHIITVTHDLLKKLPNIGKDLDEFSLDTVKMFANDAATVGYTL